MTRGRHPDPSWPPHVPGPGPGIRRPSTSFSQRGGQRDVDGRHGAGHDEPVSTSMCQSFRRLVLYQTYESLTRVGRYGSVTAGTSPRLSGSRDSRRLDGGGREAGGFRAAPPPGLSPAAMLDCSNGAAAGFFNTEDTTRATENHGVLRPGEARFTLRARTGRTPDRFDSDGSGSPTLRGAPWPSLCPPC